MGIQPNVPHHIYTWPPNCCTASQLRCRLRHCSAVLVWLGREHSYRYVARFVAHSVVIIIFLMTFCYLGTDATITLEFLPTRNRWLLGLLSMFQPLGVTICTILAYGLIPPYSCGADLPGCASGTIPCCNRASNLGWRYLVIALRCITLAIFFARTILFDFKESPKYLLSRGKEQEAVDVLHYIAKFKCVSPCFL